MKNLSTKGLTLAAIYVAISVALSPFSIPIGASKCFPVQHFVNVLAGVTLGPIPSMCCAFVTSLIRNILGTGTLLAFPGSMIGALLAGIMYKHSQRIWAACIGEVVGTGIIGALLAYPIASVILGQEVAAFVYVIPFIVSSAGGAIIACILIYSMSKTHVLERLSVK